LRLNLHLLRLSLDRQFFNHLDPAELSPTRLRTRWLNAHPNQLGGAPVELQATRAHVLRHLLIAVERATIVASSDTLPHRRCATGCNGKTHRSMVTRAMEFNSERLSLPRTLSWVINFLSYTI
jgi:hypothetical protein